MSTAKRRIVLSIGVLFAVAALRFAKELPMSESDEIELPMSESDEIELSMSESDEIEYRGEMFKITKSYPDFDDYKNDPDNIDPSETDRIIKLVSEAPIASSYASPELVIRAVHNVVFPGYGSSSGSTVQADGSLLWLLSVEIPRANKERYFVFRNLGGRQILLDDFIESDDLSITKVREESGQLIYWNHPAGRVLTRPIVARK